jgi:hypothetical protein
MHAKALSGAGEPQVGLDFEKSSKQTCPPIATLRTRRAGRGAPTPAAAADS